MQDAGAITEGPGGTGGSPQEPETPREQQKNNKLERASQPQEPVDSAAPDTATNTTISDLAETVKGFAERFKGIFNHIGPLMGPALSSMFVNIEKRKASDYSGPSYKAISLNLPFVLLATFHIFDVFSGFSIGILRFVIYWIGVPFALFIGAGAPFSLGEIKSQVILPWLLSLFQFFVPFLIQASPDKLSSALIFIAVMNPLLLFLFARKVDMKILRYGFTVVLFILLFSYSSAVYNLLPSQVRTARLNPRDMLVMASGAISSFGENFREVLNGINKGINSFWKNQMDIATGVDTKQDKYTPDTGVDFREIKLNRGSGQYNRDEQVAAIMVIDVLGKLARDIQMDIKCDLKPSSASVDELNWDGEVNNQQLPASSYEKGSYSATCRIPSLDSSGRIVYKVSYPFQSDARYTLYFAKDEATVMNYLRSMEKTSIFSPGPVSIGIGLGTVGESGNNIVDPDLIGPDQGIFTSLIIEIKKNLMYASDGIITDIDRIELNMPSPMRIKKDSCEFIEASISPEGYSLYTASGIRGAMSSDEVIRFFCDLEVEEGKENEIRQGIVTVKTIRLTMNYTFQTIKEGPQVTLLDKPGSTPGGGDWEGGEEPHSPEGARPGGFVTPIENKGLRITQCFGEEHPLEGTHSGIDFGLGHLVPPSSVKVYAVAPGRVIRTAYNEAGWGHYVIIEHEAEGGGHLYTLYAHLSGKSVNEGQYVNANQGIGVIRGISGYSTGPHLHLTVYKPKEGISYHPPSILDREDIDPLCYLTSLNLASGSKSCPAPVCDNVPRLKTATKESTTTETSKPGERFKYSSCPTVDYSNFYENLKWKNPEESGGEKTKFYSCVYNKDTEMDYYEDSDNYNSQGFYNYAQYIIEKQKNNLDSIGIDPVAVLGLMYTESRCGTAMGQDGRITKRVMQYFIEDDSGDKCIESNTRCHHYDSIRLGVKELVSLAEIADSKLGNKKEYTKERRLAFILYGYNRGKTAMRRAIEYYTSGNYDHIESEDEKIYRAMKDSCITFDIYVANMCWGKALGANYPEDVMKYAEEICTLVSKGVSG